MSSSYDNTKNVEIVDDSSADEQILIQADTETIETKVFDDAAIADLAAGPSPLTSSSGDNSAEVAEIPTTVVVEVQISDDDDEDDEDYVEGQSELIAADEEDEEEDEEDEDEDEEEDEANVSVIEKECVDLLADMQESEVMTQAFSDITEVITEIKQKVESKQLATAEDAPLLNEADSIKSQSRKRSRDQVDDEEEDHNSEDNEEEDDDHPVQKKQATSVLRGFSKFALGTIVGSALTLVALIAASPTNQ
ncbi:hypothetical protein D0Z00_004442 [Geotrichum galactomycetum]|uniref:Uncharacterized protein n=1 Tax=Geotrichum galactomycetum TaxID=27317 RepID=A0ACB6UYF0_9ASCO|nr:hypothetical protein D0Z00_004442 [Geotrichum candidum]